MKNMNNKVATGRTMRLMAAAVVLGMGAQAHTGPALADTLDLTDPAQALTATRKLYCSLGTASPSPTNGRAAPTAGCPANATGICSTCWA